MREVERKGFHYISFCCDYKTKLFSNVTDNDDNESYHNEITGICEIMIHFAGEGTS